MLQSGPAQRVTIFVGESHRYHGRSAYMAVFEFLFYHRVAGATVTRGIAGFGADHHIHTADILAASENLPIKIDFIESPARVAELLPKIREMIGDGMIALQAAEIYAVAEPAMAPEPQPARLRGAAKLLRIYCGENDRWDGKPLHEALVESLRAHDIAGVTVYRGIAGFGASGRLRKDHRLSADLPIMLTVVDSEEKIRAYLPLLDDMLRNGLVAVSDVEVVKYVHTEAKR